MTQLWREDDMGTLVKLYASGTPAPMIAQTLGRTHGSVLRRIKGMAHGDFGTEWQARLALARKARANLKGPENERQPWTPDSDRYLKELWDQGLTDAAISRSMHRTRQSVQRRRSRLGLSRQPWHQADTACSLLNFAISGRWGL